MPAPRWLPPLTVLAFGLAPFTAFLQDNRAEVSLGAVLPYALATVAPFVVAVLLVQWRRGTGAAVRVAAALGFALLVTLNFTTLRKVVDITPIGDRLLPELILWALAAVIGGLIAAWIAGRTRSAATYVFAIAAAMALLPLAQFLVYRAQAESPFDQTAAAGAAGGAAKSGPRPNVYYFLLDAYGREDVLKREFGLDVGPFVRGLESRGFVVPKRARADYPVTNLSLPSTLSMDYPVKTRKVIDLGAFDLMTRGDNAAVTAFRKLGYRYVHAEGGAWGATDCGGAEDVCIAPERTGGIAFSDTQWALLKLSPAARFIEEYLPDELGTEYSPADRVVDKLHDARVKRPFFLFSHVLTAHPPYPLRGADCHRTTGERDLRFGAKRPTPELYVGGIECTNRAVDRAVGQIIARDPGAIIVMQGDHGSDVGLDFNRAQWTWTPQEVRDRFAIFDALRLPARCRDMVSDDTVAVNTFRIVLACVGGRKPDLLEPRFFVTDYRRGEVRPYEEWER